MEESPTDQWKKFRKEIEEKVLEQHGVEEGKERTVFE